MLSLPLLKQAFILYSYCLHDRPNGAEPRNVDEQRGCPCSSQSTEMRNKKLIVHRSLECPETGTLELLTPGCATRITLSDEADAQWLSLCYDILSTRMRSIAVRGFGSKEDLEVMIAISLICTRRCCRSLDALWSNQERAQGFLVFLSVSAIRWNWYVIDSCGCNT
jgi:hypothetical protein